MKFHHQVFLSLSLATLTMATNATSITAAQWYFWVQNDSRSAIKKLVVSEDGNAWGYFDIGPGIAPGSKVKITWDESTNSQGCTQWIKAKFNNGKESTPSQINFCQDLDAPIVFGR